MVFFFNLHKNVCLRTVYCNQHNLLTLPLSVPKQLPILLFSFFLQLHTLDLLAVVYVHLMPIFMIHNLCGTALYVKHTSTVQSRASSLQWHCHFLFFFIFRKLLLFPVNNKIKVLLSSSSS